MNDNSTDETEKIISEAAKENAYIHPVNLEPGDKDLAWRYHRNMKFGFEKAINIAEKVGMEWDAIGVLDGDIVFEDRDYYKKLINALQEDSSLGIVSGELAEPINGTMGIKHRKKNFPCGACRLIRKAAYHKSGYPIEPAADSIMRILSHQAGFNALIITEAKAIQTRPTTTIERDAEGAKYAAYIKYYLGFPLIYVLLMCGKMILKGRLKNATTFLKSYNKHKRKKSARLPIPEVRKVYRKAWFGLKY
jgi:glycosyltransferase involved in cell wall biosynthesis